MVHRLQKGTVDRVSYRIAVRVNPFKDTWLVSSVAVVVDYVFFPSVLNVSCNAWVGEDEVRSSKELDLKLLASRDLFGIGTRRLLRLAE